MESNPAKIHVNNKQYVVDSNISFYKLDLKLNITETQNNILSWHTNNDKIDCLLNRN